MIDSIVWHGHATFSITKSPRIMIDPWSIAAEDPRPDIILVSHEDYDHCSPADVNKLRHPNTIVIASRTAAEHLEGDVKILRPWQVMNFGRMSIKAVPAYTFDGDHPAHREDVGFVISCDYNDIYYAGDTDFIPELRTLRCDIAILPVNATRLESNVDLVESARPRYVVPSHLGHQVTSAKKLELQAFERAISPLADVVTLPLGKAYSAFAQR